MSMRHMTMNRGDTLVEVLFAVAVFSLVIVSSMAIMNQGSATAQRALEITLVRQEIDAQAETLRFLNASYVAAYQPGVSNYPVGSPAAEWTNIRRASVIKASNFGNLSSCPTTKPVNSFIMNTHTAKYLPNSTYPYRSATTFSQIRYSGDVITNSDGLWIEAVSPTISGNGQDNAGYIDFHIRACWDSPGQSMPITLGTIVRLYEPK